MKELVFALEFRGSAAPVPGSQNRLRATTSAPSQTLRSVLNADGIQPGIEPAVGDSAVFESEVEIVGEGTFVEAGSIAYGKTGRITFKTVGHGVLGVGRQPRWQSTGLKIPVSGVQFSGDRGQRRPHSPR